MKDTHWMRHTVLQHASRIQRFGQWHASILFLLAVKIAIDRLVCSS